MTIKFRRRTYWLLFILSLSILAAATVLSLPLFSQDPGASLPRGTIVDRPWKLLGLASGSIRSAGLGGLAAALIASAVLMSVLVSFRKTVSAEIFFFSFWLLSCSFEAGRVLVLHLVLTGAAENWVSLASRLVLAARFAGYGAFLLSGLHSAGFRGERPLRSVAGAFAIGSALAFLLPLDSGAFDETLLVRTGYSTIVVVLTLALAVVIVSNFLVGASVTAEKSFRLVAVGAAALLAGHYILGHEWRPELLILAAFLMAGGARLFISRLHSYYLWQ